MHPSNSQTRPHIEEGNTIVEFIGVMLVLILPALILLTGFATVTAAHAALHQASRDSARAFIRAESTSSGEAQARQIAQSAWQQRGFSETLTIEFICTAQPCLSPGAEITAEVSATINTPLGTHLTLSTAHTLAVDHYRKVRE